MTILAIDPGTSGGLAWLHDGHLLCAPMPDTEGDILDKLREITALNGGVGRAFIEHQLGVMGPNIPVSRSAMFTFGKGYGFLLGALMAFGWRIELVRPQKWQKALSLGKKSEHGKDWKRHLKAEAQRRFPEVDVTLKTADALLLLDVARGCK